MVSTASYTACYLNQGSAAPRSLGLSVCEMKQVYELLFKFVVQESELAVSFACGKNSASIMGKSCRDLAFSSGLAVS